MGYLGAYSHDGFHAPLLSQIAEVLSPLPPNLTLVVARTLALSLSLPEPSQASHIGQQLRVTLTPNPNANVNPNPNPNPCCPRLPRCCPPFTLTVKHIHLLSSYIELYITVIQTKMLARINTLTLTLTLTE